MGRGEEDGERGGEDGHIKQGGAQAISRNDPHLDTSCICPINIRRPKNFANSPPPPPPPHPQEMGGGVSGDKSTLGDRPFRIFFLYLVGGGTPGSKAEYEVVGLLAFC